MFDRYQPSFLPRVEDYVEAQDLARLIALFFEVLDLVALSLHSAGSSRRAGRRSIIRRTCRSFICTTISEVSAPPAALSGKPGSIWNRSAAAQT
jgi:hypothetical protein